MKFKRLVPLALALAIASTTAAQAARLPQNRFSFAVRPSYTQTVSRPSVSKPLQSTAANSSYAAQVVSLVNAERARQGLPALTVSTAVQQAAQFFLVNFLLLKVILTKQYNLYILRR